MAEEDFVFGVFSLTVAARQVCLAGKPVHLTPKAFDLLVHLVRHRDRAIGKPELKEALWPGVEVEESNLTQTMFMLRKALRDAGSEHTWIETVPRVGYRFVPPPVAPDAVTARPRSFVAYLLPTMVAGLIVFAIVAASGWSRGRAFEPGRVRSIAVLPFRSTPGTTERLLADGVADQLADRLALAGKVRVLARQSSGRAAPGPVDLKDLASRLQVDAVLEGAVERSGHTFSVTARLIDGQSGRELWSGRHRSSMDLIGSDSGAGMQLARALVGYIWPGEPGFATQAHSQDAYTAFLRGRSGLAARTVPSLRQAAVDFREAISEDQAFAEAYAGLASAYVLSGVFGGLSRREAVRLGMGAASEALHLKPDLAEAQTAMAFALHVFEKRWAEAEARYRQAITLNPNLALAHHWYALLLDSQVRPQEALREIRTAAALDPLSPSINSDVGMILAHQGLFDEAIAQFRKTITMDPSYADAYQEMGWACAFAGRFDAAVTAFNEGESLGVPHANAQAGLGYTSARAGRIDEARQALREIGSAPMPDEGLRDSLQALVLLGLGENERALDLLVRAHPEGESNLRVGRIYDPIRNDPKFKELLRRSGLL